MLFIKELQDYGIGGKIMFLKWMDKAMTRFYSQLSASSKATTILTQHIQSEKARLEETLKQILNDYNQKYPNAEEV